MTIYQIDQQIESLLLNVDEETGELLIDTDQLEALQMEKEQKIENLALAVKNLNAEAKAIKDEEAALAKRRKSVEASADRAKKYLDFVLSGEKYKSAKVAVSYRSSESVQLDDEFIKWAFDNAPYLLRAKDPEPDKTQIKEQLKQGVKLEHASLVKSTSIQIK